MLLDCANPQVALLTCFSSPLGSLGFASIHLQACGSESLVHNTMSELPTPIIITMPPTHISDELYHSLPVAAHSRAIRVLDLNSKLSSSGEFRERLRVVYLADNHNFTALSYAWGSGPQ